MNVKSEPKIGARKVTLSPEQIKFYDENGYLLVPDVFDEEVCRFIIEAAETVAEPDYSVALNIHRKLDLFMEILKDPVLVSIVKRVQRHSVVATHTQFLYKRCGTPYAMQSWSPHQDNVFTKSRKGTNLTLHIFLDASDRENGGLIYWPGSHKEDILPYESVKCWKEEFDQMGISHPGLTVQVPPRYQRLDIEAPRGAIGLQDGHLIHASYPNLSRTRSRAEYSIYYINEGEWFDPGKTNPKFAESVE